MEEDAAVACLGIIVVVVGGFELAKIKLFGWLWVETGRDHDAQTTKLAASATSQQSLHHTCIVITLSASCVPSDAILWTDSCNHSCIVHASVMPFHVYTLPYHNSCSRG